MHVGLVMECDYREGRTQEEAFAEALSIAELAEHHGLDGVWLAERHFAAPRRRPIPAARASPRSQSSRSCWPRRSRLVRRAFGSARRQRPSAVSPDSHRRRGGDRRSDQSGPPRLRRRPERLSASVCRYGIPYSESRDRFQESLDVILKAWTQDRFSHSGKYFTFND